MIQDFSTAPTPPEPPELPEIYCRVMLTPEQKAIVLEKTGRELDYVDIEDTDGSMTGKINAAIPQDITPYTLLFAAMLNDYDDKYTEYLKELEQWQDEQKNPDKYDKSIEARIKAEQHAEKLKAFYAREQEAFQEATKLAQALHKPKKQEPNP